MNVLVVHLLGLGLGMSFSSKLHLLVFFIETSNELISYVIYIHVDQSIWIQIDINYMSWFCITNMNVLEIIFYFLFKLNQYLFVNNFLFNLCIYMNHTTYFSLK